MFPDRFRINWNQFKVAFKGNPLLQMLTPEEWRAMERAAKLAHAERHADAEKVRQEANYHGL